MSNSYNNISFDLSRNMALEKTKNRNSNNLVKVYFGGSDRPTLSIISSKVNSNSIKVYKCLKTNTYVLIKFESNRIYRITWPNLIAIPINNIQSNWQVICTHTNLNELQIKDLYIQYRIK